MQRLLAAFLFCLMATSALADSIVHNLTTSATSPLPAGSCFYVDQGPGTDVKLCSGYPAAIGALSNASGAANLFMATPNGSSGSPSLRAIVGADLPAPSASTLGGIESLAAVTSKWINAISTAGVPSATQPAFTDISGSPSSAQLQTNFVAALTAVLPPVNGDCLLGNSTPAWTVAACPGGGAIQVGSITGVNNLSLGTGFTTTGSSPNPTLVSTNVINTQTGTYSIVAGDANKVILVTGTPALSLPVASTTNMTAGYATSFQTEGTAGTLTATTSTINGIAGATGIKLGAYQSGIIQSDSSNWQTLLGVPQPATQTGSTFLRDDMTWQAAGSGTPGNPTATISGTAVNGSATTYMRSDAAPALSTTGVSAASYGATASTPAVPGFTVDANGRLSAASNGPAYTTTPGTASTLPETGSAGTISAAFVGVPNSTKTANYTYAAGDMGGTVNLGTGSCTSGSPCTLTVPAIVTTPGSQIFAANQSSCYSNQGTGYWTISTTPTINGLPSTSIYPGDGGCLVSNGTSLDWQPGFSHASVKSGVPFALSWTGGIPGTQIIAPVNIAMTVDAVIGTIGTNSNTTSTLQVYETPSGTACNGGTALTSNTLNLNGSNNTSQTLTVSQTTIPAGNYLCFTTTGSGGQTTHFGSISVYAHPT